MSRLHHILRLTQFVAAASVLCTGLVVAQTSTTREVRSFEVISVEGNTLVVRGADGTREHTVPNDFRFPVDGKSVPLSALKPGMKGTAVITTTTTSRPVHVTEVKSGEVMRTLGAGTIIVKGAEGIKMFSQGEADERGMRIFRDGRRIQVADLHEGDRISAVIITERPPQVMTEQQVQATLSSAATAVAGAAQSGAAAASDAASKAASAVTDASKDAAKAVAGAASSTADAATTAAQSATQSATDATAEAEGTSWFLWLIVAAIVIGIAVFVLRPKRA
jgi:hypothetical protein